MHGSKADSPEAGGLKVGGLNVHALRYLLSFGLLSLAASAWSAEVNVGISVAGEIKPGVYGRIEIGTGEKPPLVYERPYALVKPRSAADRKPLYLNVPPGHARNWAKHCHLYKACNRPTYFVYTAEYDDKDKDAKKPGKPDKVAQQGRGHGKK